jgi:hypothetical protein
MMALLGAVMVYFTACKEDTLRSNECDIVSFTVDGEAWTIKGTDITHTYPANTDVSALKPTITVSEGATVSPASGVTLSFAANVAYTVTAEDGTTKKTYTVKVTVTAATDAEITAFSTGGEAWSISGTDITKTFPYGTEVNALEPTITVSTGATVNPASGVTQNFSAAAGVAYTVTAADGTTKKTYTAKATVAPREASDACDITAFTVNGEDWDIDATTNIITYTYDAGTDVTALTPVIALSDKATVDPASSFTVDFSKGAVTYTVTAEDGTTTKTYTVTVTVAPATGAEILSFSTDGGTWTIDGTHITKTFPYGTPQNDLTPTIVVSEGATIDPASDVKRNFFSADGATYTVTSEDGETTTPYTVKATVAPNNACDIIAFSVDGKDWDIDAAEHIITHTYDAGTNVTALTPIITLSDNATVDPASSVTWDFSQGAVTYTVTAEDGIAKQIYTVTVTVAAATGAEITAFSTDGGTWTIDGKNITKTFPYGTPQNDLTPTIDISAGATVTPAPNVPQNFFTEAGVTYTVTAEDGTTTEIYTVKATVAASTEAEIITFTTDGGTWTIDGTDITKTFPNGTDVSKLTPIIVVSADATVEPASSFTRDFSQGAVTYTVTAADGTTTKTYTAKATVEPPSASDACDILGFTVNGQDWNIDATTRSITHTYPANTDVTALTPKIITSEGATVEPASSFTVDFSKGAVTYTVTAADGETEKTYTVTVTVTPPSTEAKIKTFTVDGENWDISSTTITYTYPAGTEKTNLTPTIEVSTGAKVDPASGVAKDFFTDAGVAYTVTAEDGTTKQTYIVKATVAASTEAKITAFTVGGEAWAISGTTITYTYPANTDVTNLTPVIVVSTGATVDLTGAQNFSQDVTYTVTAEDGTTKQTYIAKATVAPPDASNACELTAFVTDGGSWTISGTTITQTFQSGTDVTKLTPTITVSDKATVNPASGTERDFSQDVTYTVTAQDGIAKKTYIAKATVLASTEAKITTFTVNDKAWTISGTTITYTYPAGTEKASLTPTITVSTGAKVDPASGVAKDFFTDAGVAYTVTAEDGTTKQTYIAKATVAASTEAEIKTFTVNDKAWTISGTTITYTYPAGTEKANLTPTITVSTGAKVDPASGVAKDFFTDAGVAYTVTAEDGTTKQTYIAKATVAASTEAKITTFTVNDEAWTISGTTITHTYPANTDVTALTPTIAVSAGAKVDPASGVTKNFSQGAVIYTVTAQDGTTKQDYTVKVTVTPASTEAKITAFTAGEGAWSIIGTEITGTFPYGTTPNNSLVPTIAVSAGATVSPTPNVPQDFFAEQGVNYTVTAEDGTTKQDYTVKATIALSSECDITYFDINGREWTIDDNNRIIYEVYDVSDVNEAYVDPLFPTIYVSAGATVSPASGVGQNFFMWGGARYTVTAEDGTTKQYTAKATVTGGEELSAECDITYFDLGGYSWTIAGTNIYKEFTGLDDEVWWNPDNHGSFLHESPPTISVSAGAKVSPESSEPQNFFTEEGVDYTVTAANGTQKVYNVKAWFKQAAEPSGQRVDKTNWEAVSRNGNHDWSDLGACGNVPNPTQEHCGEGNHAGGWADKVLDDNVWTGWHSNPSNTLPQAITIDMKASKKVRSLVLHHRPDALGSEHPSWIYFYTIQVYIGNDPYDPNTEDLAAYGSGIFTYTWDGAIPATINLPKTTEGQYLMLVFPDSKVEQYISFSELDVYVAQ